MPLKFDGSTPAPRDPERADAKRTESERTESEQLRLELDILASELDAPVRDGTPVDPAPSRRVVGRGRRGGSPPEPPA